MCSAIVDDVQSRVPGLTTNGEIAVVTCVIAHKCPGDPCCAICECAHLPETIVQALLLIPAILPSTPSGPVLRTVKIRARRIFRPISQLPCPLRPDYRTRHASGSQVRSARTRGAPAILNRFDSKRGTVRFTWEKHLSGARMSCAGNNREVRSNSTFLHKLYGNVGENSRIAPSAGQFGSGFVPGIYSCLLDTAAGAWIDPWIA